MAEPYSLHELDQMIDLAKQLRYWDDLAHWQAMRERVLAESGSRSPVHGKDPDAR